MHVLHLLTRSGHWLASGLLALGAAAAWGQAFPSKPITYIVGFGAGSGIDNVARVVGQRIAESMANPVVVENRVGAAGSIALEALSKAAPDGHTILIASASDLINQYASRNAKLEIVRDFTPVALTGALPLVLAVTDSLPAKNVDELVALAKAQPGKLNWASVVGASPHFMGEAFKSARGIDMKMVPYRTTNDATADVVSGRVEVTFTTVTAAVPLTKSGKVRVLAITGRNRSSLLPDVPSTAELGMPTVDVGIGYFVLAPKGTPPGVVATLNAQFAKALASKDVRDKLIASGVEPKTSTPEQLDASLRTESARWAKLVKDLGVKVE